MKNKGWYALAISGMVFVGDTPYIFPEKERSGIEKELEKMEIRTASTNYNQSLIYTNKVY